MKVSQIFVLGKDFEPKTEQLLKSAKLPQPDERYKTEIERIVKKDHQTYEFPLSDSEIIGILEKLPASDIEGLERIVITPPLKNDDYKNYGRYIPLPGDKGKVLLFVHQKVDGHFEIVVGGDEGTKRLTPEQFKKEAYKAVLHEVGHHVGIRNSKNYSEDFAKQYATRFLYLVE